MQNHGYPKLAASSFLPPLQWAVLGANLILIVNFIVALLVPWVEANYPVSEAWFPIYIPIKVRQTRRRVAVVLQIRK